MYTPNKVLMILMAFLLSGSLQAEQDSHSRKKANIELEKHDNKISFAKKDIRDEIRRLELDIGSLEKMTIDLQAGDSMPAEQFQSKQQKAIKQTYDMAEFILQSRILIEVPLLGKELLNKLSSINIILADTDLLLGKNRAALGEGSSVLSLVQRVESIKIALTAINNNQEF